MDGLELFTILVMYITGKIISYLPYCLICALIPKVVSSVFIGPNFDPVFSASGGRWRAFGWRRRNWWCFPLSLIRFRVDIIIMAPLFIVQDDISSYPGPDRIKMPRAWLLLVLLVLLLVLKRVSSVPVVRIGVVTPISLISSTIIIIPL